MFIESAQALTSRLIKDAATESDRLNRAFELCYGRPATPQDRDLLSSWLERRRELSRSNAKAADAMPAADLVGVPPAEAAAWFGVARALINSDEFITRE